MIEFKELTDAKKIQYKDILYAITELDKEQNSLIFLYQYNGIEKILQVNNDLCRIWQFIDKNEITYNEFLINDNFDLEMVALDDAILYEQNDESYFRNRQTNFLEDFAFVAKEEKDLQGYDGIAVYAQYDEEKDIRIDLMYQHMKKENNYVYPIHLKNPIQIQITKKASKRNNNDINEMYARLDFDARKNYNSFRIATIKDYGLLKTINKDLISLQKSSKLSRYYKVLSINNNNELKVSYPFGNQYTLDEIFEYIKKLGFNTEVPKYLIDINNQKNEEYLESIILASNLKVLNNIYIKETGKSLKLIKEL